MKELLHEGYMGLPGPLQLTKKISVWATRQSSKFSSNARVFPSLQCSIISRLNAIFLRFTRSRSYCKLGSTCLSRQGIHWKMYEWKISKRREAFTLTFKSGWDLLTKAELSYLTLFIPFWEVLKATRWFLIFIALKTTIPVGTQQLL